MKMNRSRSCLMTIVATLLITSQSVFAEILEERIQVKVIVVTMFERGESRGDIPGELQLWLERLHLDTEFVFPMGEEPLYMNDDGVMAIMTGGGITNATASIMALGMDPRFDLTHSYWLVAGIAGGDPEDISLGSAAWARHVVDGDLAYEIDGREIPDSWPYGMIPLGAMKPTKDPDELNPDRRPGTISFSLNQGLVDWAFSITRDLDLGDGPGIAAYREAYNGHPAAQRPPFVTIGDNLSSSTYWHGVLLNEWANDWVPLYAGEGANFMTTDMEDSGIMTSLHRLGRDHRVDTERVLVLRTVSNYTMPPKGESAIWSKAQSYADNGMPSFESAFVVGNTVVQALLTNWSTYERELPVSAE
jgi:purine nucleoside permease